MPLTNEQVARYSRQLMLPEIGVPGQERLLGAAVLVVGAGGLGSPAALYLAAAGVGTIGLVDREAVAVNNLHRQILYASADVGRPKTAAAETRLRAHNPGIAVCARQEDLTAANVLERLQPYDLVLDGSDNFPTRYLVNDACVLLGKPFVHAAAIQLRGQLMTVRPRRSACLRCVFPEPPQPGAIPSCQDAGVLGPVVGVLGSLMGHEALKVLLGLGELLVDRLLTFDGTASRFREVAVRRNSGCAVCGDAPTITAPQAIEQTHCEDSVVLWGSIGGTAQPFTRAASSAQG